MTSRVMRAGGDRAGVVSRLGLVAALAVLAAPGTAGAADTIYWTSNPFTSEDGEVRYGNLDGSGEAQMLYDELPGDIFTGGVMPDPATGEIYWTASAAERSAIRVGTLDGSAAQAELFGQPIIFPIGKPIQGVAINPAAGKIYWAGQGVWVANLDGSGEPQLLWPDGFPVGVAIVPEINRVIYTTRAPDPDEETESQGRVAIANLDGTGTTQSLYQDADGANSVAVNHANGRVYWTSLANNTIWMGDVNGSTPQPLYQGENQPNGIAVDRFAGKLYWVTSAGDDKIRVGNLDGSGTPETLFEEESAPSYPSILQSPFGAGAPVISGGGEPGTELTCSQGTWSPDEPEGFLFRAPRSFAYRWLKDGRTIGGATESTFVPSSGGAYTCRVTAANHAGSTSQTSAAVEILPSNLFTFGKVRRNERKGTAKLTVNLPDPGELTLTGKGVKRDRAMADQAGATRLAVAPKGKARRKLSRRGRGQVPVTVRFAPAGVDPREKTKTVRLVKRD